MMASLGDELRRQRELRQISLREISDATKINIRFLEALERNDFTHLPGGQFNKGFIRAYSRHIGLDPEKLVDAYMEELQRQESESHPDAGATEVPRAPRRLSARAVLGVIALIIMLAGFGLAVWLLLPGRGREREPAHPGAGGASSLRPEGVHLQAESMKQASRKPGRADR